MSCTGHSLTDGQVISVPITSLCQVAGYWIIHIPIWWQSHCAICHSMSSYHSPAGKNLYNNEHVAIKLVSWFVFMHYQMYKPHHVSGTDEIKSTSAALGIQILPDTGQRSWNTTSVLLWTVRQVQCDGPGATWTIIRRSLWHLRQNFLTQDSSNDSHPTSEC
jgi:hypothetical protein